MAIDRSNLIDALDTCLNRLHDDESMEHILRDYPDIASQLRPMLEAGQLVRRAHVPLAEMATARERIEPRIQQVIDNTFGGNTGAGSGWMTGWWGVCVVILAGGLLLSTAWLVLRSQSDAPVITPVQVSPSVATIVPDRIEFVGIVQAVDSDMLTVNSLPVSITNARVDGNLQATARVRVIGQLTDGEVIASEIIVLEAPLQLIDTVVPAQQPTSSPMPVNPTATRDVVSIIEGPVSQIQENRITIYGIEIPLRPDDPRLDVLRPGDVIRVERVLEDSASSSPYIIEFVTVIVIVDEATGRAWRGDDCANPPPDWVTVEASSWFTQCRLETSPGNNPVVPAADDNDSDDDD